MALISSHMRIHELVMRRTKNDQRIRQLQMQLSELLKYGEHIADGSISIFEMIRTPASMFNRQLIYNQYSMDYATTYALNSTAMATASEGYQQYLTEHPEFAANQALYEEQMRQNYYREGLNQFRDYERELIHEEESAIKAEKDSIDIENKSIDAEVEGLRKARDEEVKRTFSTQA